MCLLNCIEVSKIFLKNNKNFVYNIKIESILDYYDKHNIQKSNKMYTKLPISQTKSNFEVFMKRFTFLTFVIALLLCLTISLQFTECTSAYADGTGFDDFRENVSDLFLPENVSKLNEQVYLGGYPLGLTIDGDGVTVVGLNEFVGSNGKLCCPALNAGVAVGDVVVELDGHKIFSSQKLIEVATVLKGKECKIKLVRNGMTLEKSITPCKDLSTGSYRLGLWTRDASSGVGTLTYVRKNLAFASLGHPICDVNGRVVKCNNGGVFRCDIQGVKKGQVGVAGELKGALHFDERVGSLLKNNKYGAYGTFDCLPSYCSDLIDVADIGEIQPGYAQIYCTFEDGVRRAYDIKIVKASYQTACNDKGMVIQVTDETLLAKTGGIVQGMSGSPIVQNGKLVGAVTHVFVNDPTRGYGIYAKWMLTN